MIGNNTYIGEGCTVEKSLVLGNDYYTNEKTRAASIEKGESALGIGMCLPLSLQLVSHLTSSRTRSKMAIGGGSRHVTLM